MLHKEEVKRRLLIGVLYFHTNVLQTVNMPFFLTNLCGKKWSLCVCEIVHVQAQDLLYVSNKKNKYLLMKEQICFVSNEDLAEIN